MVRLGFLSLILTALLSLAAPVFAFDVTDVPGGLRDHGKDWLKDQAKSAGQEWLLGTGQSDTMKGILDKALNAVSGSNLPGSASDSCKVAVYGQMFSVLTNLGYLTNTKEGATAMLTSGAKTLSLGAGGLSAASGAAEGGLLNWLAGEYAGAATGQAEDTLFDRIQKLFSDGKAPEFEVFEKDGRCGKKDDCTYKLKALWDIVHGRYTVYMHGDCDCSGQGAGDGVPLGEWWVTVSGPMLMKVTADNKSFTWVVGEPTKIDMEADCPCSKKRLRTAVLGGKPTSGVGGGVTGGGTSTPPPPPPAPAPPSTLGDWLKVTTTCKDAECQALAAQINTLAQEREALGSEQNQAQTEMEQAKAAIGAEGGDKELGIAPASPAKTKANANALKAAQAKMDALRVKQATMDAKLRDLWKALKDCEMAKCGRYGMVCPGGGLGRGQALASACPPGASALGTAVLAEINRARTDPQDYARTLRGADAGEAVSFLEHQPALGALNEDERLTTAARQQVDDQGPRGGTSHTGSDGSTPMSRAQAAGLYSSIVAEEIALAQTQASGVVRQLIIDAGRPGRPHRTDLFGALFKLVGVACGPNKAYASMCVVTLATTPMAR